MSPDTAQILWLLVVLTTLIGHYFVIDFLARQAIRREVDRVGGRVVWVKKRPFRLQYLRQRIS